ncbi:MAG: type I 3-dehydroquinate dehydratase [Ferroplasma sp.]|uniref:type I 3-dehydroquinate dehydratase n=1 Tax=Ferroplasma sp. TaxID=2591003 RepID=UPI00281669AB|nr:type I 3-dehydroquinate dehydratase [Ferroplasma sp.]WMT51406.1 MAG: type I 3-dehydroquinate dehydratase [Ferroplasma sp.]
MPGNSCKVYTSVFFVDFRHMKMEFENGSMDFSKSYEIRYDLFEHRDTVNLGQVLEYLNKNLVDYIFTFRSSQPDQITTIYTYAMNYTPPIVDVDIGSFNFRRSFFNNTNLMVSFHGLNNDNVHLVLKDMSAISPDIYKIALLYNDTGKFLDDLDYLYHYKNDHQIKLAYIPMGNNNSLFRLVSAITVSDYAYASYKHETAPGQIEASEFISLLGRFREKYE